MTTANSKPHIVSASPTLTLAPSRECDCDNGIRYSSDGAPYPCLHCAAGWRISALYDAAAWADDAYAAEQAGRPEPAPPFARRSMAVRVLECALTHMRKAHVDALAVDVDEELALTLHIERWDGVLSVAIEQYEAVGIRESIIMLTNWFDTSALSDIRDEIEYIESINPAQRQPMGRRAYTALAPLPAA